jgi:RNA polymerase sigma-54 factor
MLRQKQSVDVKNKLSNTLRNWLPILHSSLNDLDETMAPFIDGNPLIEVRSGFEESFEKRIPRKTLHSPHIGNANSEQIEALTIQTHSLYEILDEQISAPLFPTPISESIAIFIISNLDEYGYYEGDTEQFCHEHEITVEQFLKVHQRFACIDPVGIGAHNVNESFEFQLSECEISNEGYALVKVMIYDLEQMHSYSKEPFFAEAMRAITTFKNPPNIEYMEKSVEVIPDLMIFFTPEEGIEVKLNNEYYPDIHIRTDYGVEHEYVTEKIKEAKSLVDALDMRKATLYKVGLMIVEYQYEFFTGGTIKPLTLKTLADEFGHNPSTISRAIAGKYIACDRGIFAMKEFFTTALDEDTSNATIKDFLSNLIKNEPRDKPLSDMKLLALIQEEFKIQIVRRTLAKYRKQLNIAGSSERKKLYKLDVN